MQQQPQREHEWLQQLVGAWAFEAEAMMAPGEPPLTLRGSETVRTLGGLWVLCEGQGEMPGGDIGHTLMTLGYDPQRQRYVGTFVGSMMDFLWLYEGQVDGSGRQLALDAEGPSFSGDGQMARYQDRIEFLDQDHRTLSSGLIGPDGTWERFMTAHYRRV